MFSQLIHNVEYFKLRIKKQEKLKILLCINCGEPRIK